MYGELVRRGTTSAIGDGDGEVLTNDSDHENARLVDLRGTCFDFQLRGWLTTQHSVWALFFSGIYEKSHHISLC